MARMTSKTTSKTTSQPSRSVAATAPSVSAEQRQRMIGEAAYYRYVQRGLAPGHELEDWLEAESEFDVSTAEQQMAEQGDVPELPMQQSGSFGAAEDDLLKRSIKQHPRRDIPRIESIEPEEAPLKE